SPVDAVRLEEARALDELYGLADLDALRPRLQGRREGAAERRGVALGVGVIGDAEAHLRVLGVFGEGLAELLGCGAGIAGAHHYVGDAGRDVLALGPPLLDAAELGYGGLPVAPGERAIEVDLGVRVE